MLFFRVSNTVSDSRHISMKGFNLNYCPAACRKLVTGAGSECTDWMSRGTTEMTERGEAGRQRREDDAEEGLHSAWPNQGLSPIQFSRLTHS